VQKKQLEAWGIGKKLPMAREKKNRGKGGKTYHKQSRSTSRRHFTPKSHLLSGANKRGGGEKDGCRNDEKESSHNITGGIEIIL